MKQHNKMYGAFGNSNKGPLFSPRLKSSRGRKSVGNLRGMVVDNMRIESD